LWYLWLPVAGILGLILPANFSTTAIIFMMILILSFIGGYPIKYLFYIIGIGILSLTLFVFAAKAFEVHFDPSDYPFVIPVYPIISVDSMMAIDYKGTETPLILNADYYKTGMYEIDLIVNSLLNYDVMAESDKYKDRYKVTCQSGYGDDDTETLPVALLNAMQSQVFQWYQNRDDFHEGNVLGLIDKAVILFKREFI